MNVVNYFIDITVPPAYPNKYLNMESNKLVSGHERDGFLLYFRMYIKRKETTLKTDG